MAGSGAGQEGYRVSLECVVQSRALRGGGNGPAEQRDRRGRDQRTTLGQFEEQNNNGIIGLEARELRRRFRESTPI